MKATKSGSTWHRDLGLVVRGVALGLFLGLSGAIGVNATSGETPARSEPVSVAASEPTVRLELLGGHCKHRLAPDSSWSYREWGDYQTSMGLQPKCGQAGLAVMPFEKAGWKWGFRAAYVDLGRIDADNSFPLDEAEYFRAKESRTDINTPTYRFQGTGGSRGVTLGLATERKVGPVYVGPEAGLALLYAQWHVDIAGSGVLQGCNDKWGCADGLKATAYIGTTLRAGWLQLSVRRYLNAHASNADENPLYIGPTTGPVDAVLVGLSIPL